MSDDLGNILGIEDSASAAPAAPPATPLADLRWGRAHKLSERYLGGYQATEILVRLGGACKIIGYVLGAIAVLVGFIALIVAATDNEAASGMGVALLAILYGAIIVFYMFVLGTVVAALGQLLQATQDGAVNNSPFLTDDERAPILSLD